jgi:hypothetical protein
MLSPRSTFLLAPFLGELVLQGLVWGRGAWPERFEDGLAGVQMMMSPLPGHGDDSQPWILFLFPLLCLFAWELLEVVRDRMPLRRLLGGGVALSGVAKGVGRRLLGLLAGYIGLLVLNFALGMAAITLVGAIGVAMSPGEAGMQFLFVVIGIAYPLPLGFLVVWAYRSFLWHSRDGDRA